MPAWVLLLSVLALGPALAPGFVLSYDMVAVPDPAFSWGQLGLGAELPRAVPLDLVATLVGSVLPPALVPKAALVLALVAAGTGAAAVVPELPLGARLVAATVAVWNPYVAERLVLGHWGLLLAYGALPWLLVSSRRYLAGQTGPAAALVSLAAAALTPSGGLLALAVLVVVGVFSRSRLRFSGLTAGWVLLNAPWWLAGLLHGSASTSDPASVAAFAARGELPGGVLPTLLTLGGVWNADVVPDSRAGVFGTAAVLLSLLLIATGWRSFVGADAYRVRVLGVLGVLGLGLALLGAVPGTRDGLAWLVEQVPGAGLIRDGQKFVALLMPLLAAASAHGAARLARAVPVDSRVAVMGALCLAPLAVLPDQAFGVGGRLRAVEYPPGWDVVREQVEAERASGELLLLPWSAFRVYDWNGRRTVLDPARRFFPRDALSDDRLAVGSTVLGAEDPRAAVVGMAVNRGGLDAAQLRQLGVRLVLIQTDQPGPRPTVAGAVPVARTEGLQLLRVDGRLAEQACPVACSGGVRAAVVGIDLAAGFLALGGVVGLGTSRWRVRRRMDFER